MLNMFAKLKKKIENEGGVMTNSESPARSSGRRDSVTSLPRAGSIQHLGPSPPGSVTSESASIQDVSSSRDELAALLQRKSEQCKKLEGNISDLAALIKEKNKTIEKLEATLRQQDEITNKKLQEQKDDFERYRDKLIEGYQNDKLQYDRLLNTEEALTASRSDLEAKSRQCHAAQMQVEKLTDELGPLRQKLTILETEILKLREENMERAELVSSLSKDKAAFDKRLDEVNKEMIEKQAHNSQLQLQLAQLDGEHKTLIRNFDLLRNKTSKLLEEKDDQIDALQEKVRVLEQRLSDSSLSGDDRLSALKAERDSVEQKLEEARLQLTEVKSTWSDKITHLEDQISHLNTKIVEDSEEYAASQKITEQMKEGFHKQVEDLRARLEDAEKRALENFEISTSKDSHYEKQIEEMEQRFRQHMVRVEDSEGRLRAEITSLNVQFAELETRRQDENEEAQSKIIRLEEQAASVTENKIRLEVQVKDLEEAIGQLQKLIAEKDGDIQDLKCQIQDIEVTGSDQNKMISSQRQAIQDLQAESEKLKRERNDFEKHKQILEGEKENLLGHNADLQNQVQNLKSSNSDTKLELQRMAELKSTTIEAMRKTEAALRQKLESLERTIEQNEISKAESGLYSDRIDEMSRNIVSLQSQLSEKSKIVKKQEQMLKDLRVTLQRELKIQSVPIDDGVDLTANNISSSPVMTRRFGSDSRLAPKLQEQPQQLYQQQKYFQNYSQGNLPLSSSSVQTAATFSAQSSLPSATSGSASPVTVPGGATDTLTAHTANVKKELDKDVNFLYLKHVVLKFMLSRESEAIQLIKAVSVLLNFTHQEQQLIKETLEWKMSWFGHRPPVGKGQTSKIVPPTL